MASVALVKVTRGGKNPLFEDSICNFAEAWGVVVPMPVWALATEKNSNNKTRNFFIITYCPTDSIRINVWYSPQ